MRMLQLMSQPAWSSGVSGEQIPFGVPITQYYKTGHVNTRKGLLLYDAYLLLSSSPGLHGTARRTHIKEIASFPCTPNALFKYRSRGR